MVPFFTRFHDLAFREMRSRIVPLGQALPAGQYGFLEFYCDEAGCDCRRVILHVLCTRTGGKVWATINYGWERPAFYERWCHGDPMGRKMAGASLEPCGPQTEHSAALLDLFRAVIRDRAYVNRLKRHYRLFKGAVARDGVPPPDCHETGGRRGEAGPTIH